MANRQFRAYAPNGGQRCLGLARVKADIADIGISGEAGYLFIDTQPLCYVSHIMGECYLYGADVIRSKRSKRSKVPKGGLALFVFLSVYLIMNEFRA